MSKLIHSFIYLIISVFILFLINFKAYPKEIVNPYGGWFNYDESTKNPVLYADIEVVVYGTKTEIKNYIRYLNKQNYKIIDFYGYSPRETGTGYYEYWFLFRVPLQSPDKRIKNTVDKRENR